MYTGISASTERSGEEQTLARRIDALTYVVSQRQSRQYFNRASEETSTPVMVLSVLCNVERPCCLITGQYPWSFFRNRFGSR